LSLASVFEGYKREVWTNLDGPNYTRSPDAPLRLRELACHRRVLSEHERHKKTVKIAKKIVRESVRLKGKTEGK